MNAVMKSDTDAVRPHHIDEAEWALRIKLAQCYRIFDHMGWTMIIFNHITARIPGPEHHFLINPFGLRYDEVTASNLVKIDIDGNPVGESNYAVNPAGFIIHSASMRTSPKLSGLCIPTRHKGLPCPVRPMGLAIPTSTRR